MSPWLIVLLSAWDLQGKANAQLCSVVLINTVSHYITVIFMRHRAKTLAFERRWTAFQTISVHGVCDAKGS